MNIASPCKVSQLSQPRLDEIIRKRAEILAKDVRAEIHYDSNVTKIQSSFLENSKHITLTIHDERCNSTRTLDASYVVVADGAGSKFRDILGIGTTGLYDIETFASIHFTSKKLGKVIQANKKSAMLSFVFNEKAMGVVVSHDIRCGDWVIHSPFFPPIQRFDRFTENNGIHSMQIIRDCIGIEITKVGIDDIEIKSVRPWGMHGICCDCFSALENRVFLVGDAAHQLPPSGGFGVNTGLLDAHNLAWKLAHALSSSKEASDLILSTYDLERRPATYQTLSVAIDSYRRGLEPAQALCLDRAAISTAISMISASGDSMGASAQWNENLVDGILWAGKQHLRAPIELLSPRLRRVVEAQKGLPLLFPRTDKGFCYQNSPALFSKLGDNHREEEPDFWLQPSFPRDHQTKWHPHQVSVGRIIPHVWLLSLGKRTSSLDIARLYPGKYIFFCVNNPEIDRAAREILGELRVIVMTVLSMEETSIDKCSNSINTLWLDSSSSREVFTPNLCILIRPDSHIAWLEQECSRDKISELARFLEPLI